MKMMVCNRKDCRGGPREKGSGEMVCCLKTHSQPANLDVFYTRMCCLHTRVRTMSFGNHAQASLIRHQ